MQDKELGLEMYRTFVSEATALPCRVAHTYFMGGILWDMTEADGIYPIIVSVVSKLRKATGLSLDIVLDNGGDGVHVVVLNLERPCYYYRKRWKWDDWHFESARELVSFMIKLYHTILDSIGERNKAREKLENQEKEYRERAGVYFGAPYQYENEYYRGKADGICEALKETQG